MSPIIWSYEEWSVAPAVMVLITTAASPSKVTSWSPISAVNCTGKKKKSHVTTVIENRDSLMLQNKVESQKVRAEIESSN